jgi:hypothetical protein
MTKLKMRVPDVTRTRYEAMTASTVLLELSFGWFCGKRHASLSGVKMETTQNVEQVIEQVPVSEQAFMLSRRLLALPVGAEIRSLFGRTKEQIRRISVPAFDRDGVYRLSYAAVEQAEALLLAAVEELEPLRAPFREAYDSEVQKMRELQREKFNAKDYPSAWDAAQRWRIDWNYLETAGVPDALKGVNALIHKRATETAQQRANEAVAAVEQTLRAGLLACVEKMRTDLQATTKLGKPRSYRADALAKVTAFFSTFPLRNFIQDGVSGDALTQMNNLLNNIPSADALDDEFLRLEVVQGLAGIADTVRPFVADIPRAIALPDDD